MPCGTYCLRQFYKCIDKPINLFNKWDYSINHKDMSTPIFVVSCKMNWQAA